MKRRIRNLLVVLAVLSVVIPIQARAASPVVTIERPSADPNYSTGKMSIDLSGTVAESGATLDRIWWINNGGIEVNAPSLTDWTHSWSFNDTVDLVAGANEITVFAEDVAGNIGSDTIIVTYDPYAPGTIFPGTGTKAKFTFYYDKGTAYLHVDRFSVNAIISMGSIEFLPPPEGSDPKEALVKMAVGVAGGADRVDIFSQMVPAGLASLPYDNTLKKYWYKYHMPESSTKGIIDLQFFPVPKNSTLRFYAFAANLDFMPDLRASMTAAQYLQFLRNITDFEITIKYGDSIWIGNFPLKVANYDVHKIEFTYNR